MPCVDDQVVSVRRALDLLDAFGIDDGHLTIAELARRTALPKTSALRLARTLQSSGYLVQEEGGAWRLGPSTAWLAARYQVAFDLKGAVRPALQAGKLFENIRRDGFHITIGEARKRSASVSAPVFGPGWSVVGAINISCSSEGVRREDLAAYATAVMDAGRRLSSVFMQAKSISNRVRPPASYWHP